MQISSEQPDLSPLARIFRRRWSGPILAMLADPATARSGRARLGAMAATLGAAPHIARATVADLRDLGLVEPDTAHGHPLRPELGLTALGLTVGPGFIELDARLGELDLREIGYRKWSLPTLGAVGEGPARFGVMAGSLTPVTDRALSLALGDLVGAGLVERGVVNAAPPRPVYASTRAGLPLAQTARDLARALN